MTILFFYLKNMSNKKISSSNEVTSSDLNSWSEIMLFIIYFLIVVSINYFATVKSLELTCSNNSMNYATAVSACVCGWIFIFLVMVIIIWKTSGNEINIVAGFADVYGYLFVNANINNILSEIMYPTSELKNTLDTENKKELETAAETIMKTTDSFKLFVNKFTPFNFQQMWDNLSPIMKKIPNLDDYKEKLFHQVLLRYNIGECFWYIYTGIFVCSFVSYLALKSNCAASTKELISEMAGVPPPNSGGPNPQEVVYDPTL